MSDFEKFKEELPRKEDFYSSLIGKKLVTKTMNIILRFGITLKWKRWKIIMFYLKRDVILLPDVFEKFRNNSLIMDYVRVIIWASFKLGCNAMPTEYGEILRMRENAEYRKPEKLRIQTLDAVVFRTLLNIYDESFCE